MERMKVIDMTNININEEIKTSGLVLDNYRMPFLKGTVRTPGNWDVGFEGLAEKADGKRGLKFGIIKRSNNEAVASGGFFYDEVSGVIDEDSLEFTLYERFRGVTGISKSSARGNDIRRILRITLRFFAYINAVEEVNAENCEKKRGPAKAQKASSERQGLADADEEDIYIPQLVQKTAHIYPEDTDREKRDYQPKVESYSRRGHWRHYSSGKSAWIEPRICHFHK